MAVATREHNSTSPEQTEDLGELLAADLQPGDIVYLEGDLAAGKTTLVRGLVRGLGGDPDEVSSPSFVILQSYPCHHRSIAGAGAIRTVHHVDCYRLADDLPVLREVGLEEVLSETDAVIAVEWPRAAIDSWLPRGSHCWLVRLTLADDGSRLITLSSGAAS